MISTLLEQTNVIFPDCYSTNEGQDLYDWASDYLAGKFTKDYFEFTISEKWAEDGSVYYYVTR